MCDAVQGGKWWDTFQWALGEVGGPVAMPPCHGVAARLLGCTGGSGPKVNPKEKRTGHVPCAPPWEWVLILQDTYYVPSIIPGDFHRLSALHFSQS